VTKSELIAALAPYRGDAEVYMLVDCQGATIDDGDVKHPYALAIEEVKVDPEADTCVWLCERTDME
jgi:hypothetical protein